MRSHAINADDCFAYIVRIRPMYTTEILSSR